MYAALECKGDLLYFAVVLWKGEVDTFYSKYVI